MKLLPALSILLSLATPTLSAPQPPNILLILSDDHSAPHVGCYGNPDIHTPNLDRLARDGLRFTRAYTAAPQCVPSRASILTGRHPVDIGMTRFSAALPNDVVTFPELLKQHAGFYAGVCGRTYHLSGNPSYFNNPAIKSHLSPEDFPHFDQRLDYVKTASGDAIQLRHDTLKQLNEFLDKAPKDKPFFLQLCWSDPHRPFTTEELPFHHDPAKLHLPAIYPDNEAVRKDLAAYYDEVARMDSDTGKVLKTLEDRHLTDNTLVIFMGDNGASQFRGKGTLNELGIHVPLIARWPNHIKPGSTSDALVSGEDLAPTLLQLANVEVPANLSGLTFLPVLADPAAHPANARIELVSERGPHASSLPRGSNSFDLGRVIVTPRYKLIYNATWQLPYESVDFRLHDLIDDATAEKLSPRLKEIYLSPQRPIFELYDLEKDPDELTNLAGTPAARPIEQDLKSRLAAWMIHHHDFLPLPLPGNQNNANRRNNNTPATATE